ncbi:MAG: hypothetical protein FJ091_00415 [Deltaproteobacteria bacterium]|nr:hypothetical protein [Deltaproteobacteria bacterium]
MTLEQLGNLGDFVAAVATVVTLAYLALQIRASASATRAASHQATTDSFIQANLAISQNAELARIWVAGCAQRSPLSAEDRQRFDTLLLSYFHIFDSIHYQAHAGTGERELLRAEERSIATLVAMPGVREWWAENPYAFSTEFRAYIDGLIAGAAR